MWIFTNQGFISGVCARKKNGGIDQNRIVVRARSGVHLYDILEQHGLSQKLEEMLFTPHRDYAHRVVLTRVELIQLIIRIATSVDYDNFKDSCHAERPLDKNYHRLLMATWRAGYDMQQQQLDDDLQSPDFGDDFER